MDTLFNHSFHTHREKALIFDKLKETEGTFKTILEKRDNKTRDLNTATDIWYEMEDYCQGDALNETCVTAEATKRKAKRVSKRMNETYDSYIQDMSMVHFYFKELGVVKYSRDELYGAMDVIGKGYG